MTGIALLSVALLTAAGVASWSVYAILLAQVISGCTFV